MNCEYSGNMLDKYVCSRNLVIILKLASNTWETSGHFWGWHKKLDKPWYTFEVAIKFLKETWAATQAPQASLPQKLKPHQSPHVPEVNWVPLSVVMQAGMPKQATHNPHGDEGLQNRVRVNRAQGDRLWPPGGVVNHGQQIGWPIRRGPTRSTCTWEKQAPGMGIRVECGHFFWSDRAGQVTKGQAWF